MAIPEGDYKILWGRAAGRCSNPSCREELTIILDNSQHYNVGEMAHIIARSKDGPRGSLNSGPDTYENLILLCPTCHRKIDKAPDHIYPAEMLHSWKQEHEALINRAASGQKFQSRDDLFGFVSRLLIENEILWRKLGPQSSVAVSDPGSNLYRIWDLRKLDTIVPNNRKIVTAIESNLPFLSNLEYGLFLEFKIHALSFEDHQYHRTDNYPRFPRGFSEIFSNGE